MPTLRNDAKLRICEFSIGVAEAITEFHDKGYAHMDVRVENVGFNERGHPVLLDIDRCVLVNDEATSYSVEYGKSVMYLRGTNEWTCGQQD